MIFPKRKRECCEPVPGLILRIIFDKFSPGLHTDHAVRSNSPPPPFLSFFTLSLLFLLFFFVLVFVETRYREKGGRKGGEKICEERGNNPDRPAIFPRIRMARILTCALHAFSAPSLSLLVRSFEEIFHGEGKIVLRTFYISREFIRSTRLLIIPCCVEIFEDRREGRFFRESKHCFETNCESD